MAFLAVFLFGCTQETQNPLAPEPPLVEQPLAENQLCFEEKCIQIERALTSQEQSRGLMYRESLCEECGMLFVFGDEQTRTFWMKNTLIPLDLVWINAEKEVVGVTQAEPCESDPCPTYSSPEPAKYVLEVNAGFAQENGIKEGSVASFK